MAIHTTQNAAPAFSIRYSAFLGMLYVSNTEVEQHIKEAKALVGETEVKKGFQGNKGDSPSAKALSFLKDKGVVPVKVSGTLTSARVIEREVDGRKTPYLTVCLKDDDGRYYLSVDLGHSGAQMLVRKLANAEPGVATEISMFATYGQREGASRPYADHGASVKQNGKEVAGISPKDALAPRVDAAMKALEDAGVSKEDKETFAKRRAKVELDYHKEVMEAVNGKFTKFYADREMPAENDEFASHKEAA